MSDLSNTELAKFWRDEADAYLARAEAAEARLDAVTRDNTVLAEACRVFEGDAIRERQTREAAEARLDAVTRELAKWQRVADGIERACQAAEADRDRYKAALEQIDTSATLPDHYDASEWWKHVASKRREVAAAALRAAATEACDHPEVSAWGYCQVCTQAVGRAAATEEPDLGSQLAYHRQRVVDIERELRADEGKRG